MMYLLTEVMKWGRCVLTSLFLRGGTLGSKDSIWEVRIHIVKLTLGLIHLFFFFFNCFVEIQFTYNMSHAFEAHDLVVSG